MSGGINGKGRMVLSLPLTTRSQDGLASGWVLAYCTMKPTPACSSGGLLGAACHGTLPRSALSLATALGMRGTITACKERKLQPGMALGFPGGPRAELVAENQIS